MKNQNQDTYKPMSEKSKLAFLFIAIWGICTPIIFTITNRNTFKNAISDQLLYIHWALLGIVILAWFIIWKKRQVIRPLIISILISAVSFLGLFIAVMPKVAYFDAMVYISKLHPEVVIQAYISDEELKQETTKMHYYLTPAKTAYNPFLKYDYVIYGIDSTTKKMKTFIVSSYHNLQ